MLAIIIASAIMGKPNLTTCPKNRKHYNAHLWCGMLTDTVNDTVKKRGYSY
jgi:hypothetical protein